MAEDQGSAAIPDEPKAHFRATVPRYAGSTSVLYEGRDPATGAPVLVKVVRESALPSSAERQRVRRELQKLVSLRHASLSSVLAVGEEGGRLWLAREFIEGESLSERLARRGPMPVAEAARIGTRLAAALGELHRLGVLHRDVRPGHVLLGIDGSVRLVDAAVGRTLRTSDGRAVTGTPGYAAPEAVAGKLVSFRSDLYALGATLFEMLTGAAPFGPPDSPRVLALQAEGDPPQLSVPAPTGLVRLVASLLAREPRERPFSAQQLERQLEVFTFASADDDASEGVTVVGAPPREDDVAPPPALSATALRDEHAPARSRREEFDDSPTQVGENPLAAMPSSGAKRTVPPSSAAPRGPTMPPLPGSSVAQASGHPSRGAVPRMPTMPPAAPAVRAPTVPPVASASVVRASTVPPLGAKGVPAQIPDPSHATGITGGSAQKATLMGLSAPSTAREPAPAPYPVESSGSVSSPINEDSEFEDDNDTIVQEDSRIFGVPEAASRNPDGSAVPPLPDAVAAQVLTGARASARRAAVTASPSTLSNLQPLPASSNSTARAGAPPYEQGAGAHPNRAAQPAPAPIAAPADGPVPVPASTAGEYNPFASLAGQAPSPFTVPYPARGPTVRLPAQSATAPATSAGLVRPSAQTLTVQAQSRRSLLPWLLAGIGIAGMAGASGYLLALRRHPVQHNSRSAPSAATTQVRAQVPAPAPVPALPAASAALTNAPTPGAPTPASPSPIVVPAVATAPSTTPSVAPEALPTPTPTPTPAAVASTSRPASSPARGAVRPALPVAHSREDGLVRARQALARRDWIAARTLLDTAGRQQPNNAEVHYLLGDLHLRTRNLPAAVGEFRTAVRMSPRNLGYLRRLADAQVAFGDRAGATQTLRQILAINPRDAGAQQQLDLMTRGQRPAPANMQGTGAALSSTASAQRPGVVPSPASAQRPGAVPAGAARPGTTASAQQQRPGVQSTRPAATGTSRPGGMPIVNTWGPPPRPAAPANGSRR